MREDNGVWHCPSGYRRRRGFAVDSVGRAVLLVHADLMLWRPIRAGLGGYRHCVFDALEHDVNQLIDAEAVDSASLRVDMNMFSFASRKYTTRRLSVDKLMF